MGKVDVSRSGDTDYINSVRHWYFFQHDNHNFCCNFCSYALSQELEDPLSGYCQEQQVGIVSYLLFNFWYALCLTLPPLSLLISDNASDNNNNNNTSNKDDAIDNGENNNHKHQEDMMGNMAISTKKNSATAIKKAGMKTPGEDVIDLDPPLSKK
jgi:hypothetical protein